MLKYWIEINQVFENIGFRKVFSPPIQKAEILKLSEYLLFWGTYIGQIWDAKFKSAIVSVAACICVLDFSGCLASGAY